MKSLIVNSLCGIKNQMYSSEQYIDSSRKHKIANGFFDINSMFWSEMFSPDHVKEIICQAQERLINDTSPKTLAVINNPEQFYTTYLEALDPLHIPSSEQVLFQSLETLEIICCLFSKMYSEPFKLSIANGYIHSKFSAKDLLDMCLLQFCNPYLQFIETKVIPQIINYSPQILVLSGKPNIASFAIAKIIKEKIPGIFICSADNESDYYSLRKIQKFLSKNTAFFSTYNCVIFGDTETSLLQIKEALSQNVVDLNSVPDIMFSLDNGITIKQTSNNVCLQHNRTSFVSPSLNVINLKLFPHNHCYWNKCSFCGINAKYTLFNNNLWDVDSAIKTLEDLYKNGAKKIWFLDEAIPAKVLYKLSTQLISRKIHIDWHVRTRIEPQYVDENFIKVLKKAGLKHILFGFESASERILKIMKKYSFDFNYLEISEKIVAFLNVEGIKVHFSAILGIPTETQKEMYETSTFLKYLYNNYPNFSYNVNSFYLDIGSKMYKRWEDYGISSLSFPCSPKYFLDNHINWNSFSTNYKLDFVEKEQKELMLKQYPWYPKGTLVSPNTFFSFWEYSRYSLCEIFKYKNKETCEIKNKKVKLSPFVSFLQINSDQWMLYNLKNHHYVIGGDVINEIATTVDKTIDFSNILKKHTNPYKEHVHSLITQLTRMEFFIAK